MPLALGGSAKRIKGLCARLSSKPAIDSLPLYILLFALRMRFLLWHYIDNYNMLSRLCVPLRGDPRTRYRRRFEHNWPLSSATMFRHNSAMLCSKDLTELIGFSIHNRIGLTRTNIKYHKRSTYTHIHNLKSHALYAV